MDRSSPFSYQCNACGRCCHNQVITVFPYDVIRLARAAHLSTTETIARFTLRRGSLLRFDPTGACLALVGARCTVHLGRPLACRLYPLGLERGDSRESFSQLEPAAGSAGVYGMASTVADFLESQHVAPYLDAIERYHSLILLMRARIDALIDLDRIEPYEFWRRAFHEAMRETNYDPNPLITSHARLPEGPIQWPCPTLDHGGTERLYTDSRFATPDGRACFVPTEYMSLRRLRTLSIR
jgi:Fe-S-cluster containining protein